MHKRKSYDVSDGGGGGGGNGVPHPNGREHDPDDDHRSPAVQPFLLEVRAEDKVGLKRSVTLVNAIGIIVGSIIGSGIFLTPGEVYDQAQGPTLSLLVWAGCGLFSLVGAICFAELGTAITRSGGDYAYILEAFGPLPAFLTLWVTVLVLRPTTAAIVAVTFAKYVMKPFFLTCDLTGDLQTAELLLAAACLVLLTAVNCLSVKWAMKIQDVFTAGKLIALAVITLTGFFYAVKWSISEDEGHKLKENVFSAPFEESGSKTEYSIVGLSLSFYNGLFAYAGWNFLNFVTEELKDPYKNLPRAIWVGLPLVTIVYVLANTAYFLVLTPRAMIGTEIGATFGGITYSAHFQWVIPVFVALSTFGGVNGTLFTTARLFFAGAEEGQMPEILACVHVKRSTPVPALIFSCAAALAVMLVGNIKQLIVYVSFVLWVSTGVSVAALVWLRRTQPDLPRPIRVSLVWPYVYILLTAVLVGCSIVSEPKSTGMGALITLTGVPVYLIFIWWPERTAALKKRKPSTVPGLAAITKFLQKLLNVVPPEKNETLL